MDSLKIRNFGPIQEANVEFGDLTLLVGPQASGKSIFLQLLKLIEDKRHIRNTLEQYNYVWDKNTNHVLDCYFGEGMFGVWRESTEITYDNKSIEKIFLWPKPNDKLAMPLHKMEKMFYIPAQRVLSISDGRPKQFSEYDTSTPYVLKYFSEMCRQMLQHRNWNQELQFPRSNVLKEPLTDAFKNSIFQDGKVLFDAKQGQKKFSLLLKDMSLPFMTWSSGQKEFMPLLLAFYWLAVNNKSHRRDNIEYVVIEEPEMGLHPQAIQSIILQVVELISRDYKVIISTHSPVFLEFAWAFQFLKKSKAKEDAFLELFNLPKSAPAKKLFKNILSKSLNTFYFERENDKVRVKDISALDAGSDEKAVSEWGGLSSFAGKAGDVILKYLPDEEK